jgi:glucosylceramidase
MVRCKTLYETGDTHSGCRYARKVNQISTRVSAPNIPTKKLIFRFYKLLIIKSHRLFPFLIWITICSICSCNYSLDQPTNVINSPTDGPSVNVLLTYPDRTYQFDKASPLTFKENISPQPSVITIDTTTRQQTMDGFGYTLTGGSAQLINQKLSAANRSALLKEFFLTEQNGIGVSYLRISMGASDLDDHVFSYNDLSSGQTDPTLASFSLDADRVNLILVLKEILTLNPGIKIIATPWSAPAWMKTNNNAKGGNLKTELYPVYANYFVKYIQQMAGEGITIDAVTAQNEPENPYNTPSMLMAVTEQNDFIKSHLAPAFIAAGIITKIILFDHNCDHPNYPISILNDNQTKQLVDGTAFHLYAGDISALSTVHTAHPTKNIYFTEQYTSGTGNFGGDLRWHVKNLIVGAPRNWSRNVLEWNLANDENFKPHTDGGCSDCLGAITINSITSAITRNVSYYIIAHASKFVRPGSVRVNSNAPDNLLNVAFVAPDGKKVLIVLNDNNAEKTFSIAYKHFYVATTLPSGGVGTYYW